MREGGRDGGTKKRVNWEQEHKGGENLVAEGLASRGNVAFDASGSDKRGGADRTSSAQ